MGHITVTVTLNGPLARGAGPRHVLQVPTGTMVRDVLHRLDIQERYVKLVAVNGQKVAWDTVLNDQDVLVVFPPVAGG